jgi:hypothetical protein
VQKKVEKLAKQFYAGVAKLAHAEKFRLTEQQATEMRRRILNSFALSPDSGELADGFVAVINYFSGIGYWRGYKNAKKHYATLTTARRTPDGRQGVRRALESMLEEDIDMSAEKICEQLDKMGLSASFDLRINKKQKTIHVGPGHQFCWKHVRKEDSLKKMVSRIRNRLRKERRAEAWMKLADRALASNDAVSSTSRPRIREPH